MGVLDTLGAATAGSLDVTMIVDKDLHAEWGALNARLADAAGGTDPEASLASVNRVVDEMEAMRERVEASQVTFSFHQMNSWTDYLELQADHPPRQDKLVDKINGYNVATFPPALIRAACYAVTDHEGDRREREDPGDPEQEVLPEDTWSNLFRSFNSRQMNELYTAAKAVNDRTPAVPPSARSLLASQDSGASLAQPGPGTSAPADSKDGSRRTSPASTTSRPRKKAASKKASTPPSPGRSAAT